MQGLTLKELGEFGFIERIKRRFQEREREDVVVGIGDDVAVVDAGSFYLLATCDAQIDGVHFISGKIPPRYSGRRLVAVNASDIAAMGGYPLWALVAMNAPENTDVSYLEEFYEGMAEELEKIGASLIGGNCARTDRDLVFDLFLMGRVEKSRMVTRSGAMPGDVLIVSGTLGKARAGLELALKYDAETLTKLIKTSPQSQSDAFRRNALLHYFAPEPRIELGSFLATRSLAHAMIDISDGLIQDVSHICKASGVDVVLDVQSIPVDGACVLVAGETGSDPLEWALTGGEDYELLFAANPRDYEKIIDAPGSSPNLSVIGHFREGRGQVWIRFEDGSEKPASAFSRTGWNHY